MTRIVTLFLLATLAATGCCMSTKTPADDRDYLIGWYELPNRHYRTREVLPGPGILIPVFKRGGTYYSVCHGMEVPLKVCPDGLEWGLTESSMRGTKLGVDEASKAPYIIIEDANAQYEADLSTSGEKQFMTKIDRPSGLLDPTTAPPRTTDDFLGCYQPVWFPVFRWILSKDGDKYHLEGHTADKGSWKSEEHESTALEPLSDKLGFAWSSSKKKPRLVFNRELKRFECAMGPNGNLAMPLVRVTPSLPPGTGTPSPAMGIGIPSWR